MDTRFESGDRPLTAAEEQRAVLLETLVFVLIAIAIASYGLIQHNSAAWMIGALIGGGALGAWFSHRWIARRHPRPRAPERAMIGVAAGLLMAILAAVLALGFLLVFQKWFL